MRPPRCLLCALPADTAHALCTGCQHDLPWLGRHCAICAEPLADTPDTPTLCGRCQLRTPAFSRVETPWRYAFPLDSLIIRFKHQQAWPLGRLLAMQLAEHLQHAWQNGLPRPECLLPVPLAEARLRRRGFNQAALLAQWLGTACALPVDTDNLQRVRDTTAQQQLDAAARQLNLRQAFRLQRPAAVAGAHLALVDDVLTTGATADTLASLLRAAGAARVDVYCLARTPANPARTAD
ncbi:ComF family protein [Pseudomonas sp. NW5]|uniref:ComF family protein n=1 Tax=Pseudomonas sp. NW5 TaxID=2934934 RepID=UPI0020220023|nr:ComF family protein [Pseudomonas sp. NW5]